MAEQTIHEICAAGKHPILVGGTGLYARSLLRGVSFDEQGRDENLRSSLTEEAALNGIEPLMKGCQGWIPRQPGKIPSPQREAGYSGFGNSVLPQGNGLLPSRKSVPAGAPPRYRSLVLCLSFRDRQSYMTGLTAG